MFFFILVTSACQKEEHKSIQEECFGAFQKLFMSESRVEEEECFWAFQNLLQAVYCDLQCKCAFSSKRFI